MTDLAARNCVPCRGGVPALAAAKQQELLRQVDEGWAVIEGHHLERTFQFRDFLQALEFTNQVGKLAEQEGHHPEIHLGWGKARLEIWTHAIDGLTESDFILAAKIDQLSRS